MARNDEEEISTLEEVAARAGYNVEVKSRQAGEPEIADQFHRIADHLAGMTDKTPAERRRRRQEMSKHIKKLSDVVRAKHVQYGLLPFRCNDEYDKCVRKQKKRRKSFYLCYLALYICLANSMTSLLAAIALAKAGGHLG